ncbi:MAG: flagellar hook-basal body complex protein [candidate division Zixibacteria bacterium]
MMSSLFAGVTGLRNHQTKMNVIGNNISNVNTIGFKGGRVTFQEALVQTLKGAGRPTALSGGTNPVQMGLGMKIAAIDTLFHQGGLENTGQITDLAIQGSGFFVLSDGIGEFYSRAGAFGIDAQSYLVDPGTGWKVRGKMADSTGHIPAISTIGDIRLPFGQQDPAHATTTINLANNLDSAATDSIATLMLSGGTGIDQVTGMAEDGAGGLHVVVIDDNGGNGQAVRSTFDPTTAGPGNLNGAMTGNTTLADLGVDATGLDFDITVDGTTTTQIRGLTLLSTIANVVDSINNIAGVTCTLDTLTDPSNAQVIIERSKAGSNSAYYVTSSAGNADAAGVPPQPNLINRLFGLDGAGVQTIGGLDHTFTAVDSFTPFGKAAESPHPLIIAVDETTGMAMGVEDLGGGGITIKTSSYQGISAGTLEIQTAATQHSTSITTYDSQGGKHTVIMTFTRTTTDNLWDWAISLPGDETIMEGGSGTIRFNTDGSLLNFQYNGGASSLRFDPGNGGDVVDIMLNSGSTSQFNGLTGFAAPFTASAIYQDGYGMGILENMAISPDGTITGLFSNGLSRTMAQVILADFNNKGGLRRAGHGLYKESANSGTAIHGVAGETVSGTISSGALESSNVDIAMEFTNMITAQRGFQANARVITTSDSMLDELVNLKR